MRLIKAEKALRNVEDIIKRLGDGKVIGSYYLEFNRRLEILRWSRSTANLALPCWT